VPNPARGADLLLYARRSCSSVSSTCSWSGCVNGARILKVLFGWDGDDLHLFQVGQKRYTDRFTDLERTGDEEAVRIRDVLTPGGKIEYTYDLGVCWEHEITLEKMVPREPEIYLRNRRRAHCLPERDVSQAAIGE
jgi:Plasmid pRiA4b ORF-3-like protein